MGQAAEGEDANAEGASEDEKGDRTKSKDLPSAAILGGEGLRYPESANLDSRTRGVADATVYSLAGPSVVTRAEALFQRAGLDVTELRRTDAPAAAYRVVLVRGGPATVRDLVSDLESLADARVLVALSPPSGDGGPTRKPALVPPSPSPRNAAYFVLVDH